MLTQLLSWAATAMGFASTWMLGRRMTSGWVVGVLTCALWGVVDVRVHVYAGVVSVTVTIVLTVMAWRRWRAGSTRTSVLTDTVAAGLHAGANPVHGPPTDPFE